MISYIKFEFATTYFYIIHKIPTPAQLPALPTSPPPPALPRISFEPRPQRKAPWGRGWSRFYAAGAATYSSFTKD